MGAQNSHSTGPTPPRTCVSAASLLSQCNLTEHGVSVFLPHWAGVACLPGIRQKLWGRGGLSSPGLSIRGAGSEQSSLLEAKH